MRVKWIFNGVVICVIGGLIFSGVKGKNQNHVYRDDFNTYIQATDLIKNGNGKDALESFKKLSDKYPNSPNVLRLLGIVQGLNGEYQAATESMQNALNLRPFLVTDATFNAQFGEYLYKNREYEKSKVFLNEALNREIAREYQPMVENYLSRINVIEMRNKK